MAVLQPTVLVALVCADSSRDQGPVRVQLSLAGSDAATFPDIEVDWRGGDRCAHVRDLISAGVKTAGVFSYRIRVLDGTRVVVEREHTFEAASPVAGAQEEPG